MRAVTVSVGSFEFILHAVRNSPGVTHWDDRQPSQGVLDGQCIQDGLPVIQLIQDLGLDGNKPFWSKE